MRAVGVVVVLVSHPPEKRLERRESVKMEWTIPQFESSTQSDYCILDIFSLLKIKVCG